MTVERIGIIGSGTIATGLAVTVARRDPVVICARTEASAARAAKRMEKLCERLECPSAAARVTLTTDMDVMCDRSFVIEAIAEDVGAKADVIARMGTRTDPATVLATTTSSLSVAELAGASGRPERFVGFHVFNPVPQMKLIELVFPGAAGAGTRARAIALCERLGKLAIEAPDSAGFVVNRLLFPYLFSAVRLAEESGMDAESIDACMIHGAGHPMGPLALLDYVGLDVAVAIGESLAVEVPPSLRDLVAQGALGRKAGRGLYSYNG